MQRFSCHGFLKLERENRRPGPLHTGLLVMSPVPPGTIWSYIHYSTTVGALFTIFDSPHQKKHTYAATSSANSFMAYLMGRKSFWVSFLRKFLFIYFGARFWSNWKILSSHLTFSEFKHRISIILSSFLMFALLSDCLNSGWSGSFHMFFVFVGVFRLQVVR